MQLSIIIPTWNGKHLLEQMLPSLIRSLAVFQDSEIIVVDNGSTDETVAFVKEVYPKIKVRTLPKNKGFSGAVSQGAEHAQGTWLVFLNNDCYLYPDTIEKMMHLVQSNSDIIATSPVILKSGKTSLIENAGYVVDLKKGKAEVVTDINFPRKNKEETTIPDGAGMTHVAFRSGKVYGLSGTCLLIRRDVYETVGGFDPAFHSYLEDVDLCIRLAKAGYRYAITPDAFCDHKHMATSSRMGLYKQRQDFKNWIRIIVKNYPFSFLLRNSPTLLVERLRNVNGLIKKSFLAH
ncbi:glycosyltransferase family 2 protein [Candidatus Roizmanbacteria bacterium]|nr:glycosyltransferase family 2 protein [Candidatus Roizmanbacteria bacterium]